MTTGGKVYKKEGIDETKVLIAKGMLLEGEPIDKVARLTGLTYDEVEQVLD